MPQGLLGLLQVMTKVIIERRYVERKEIEADENDLLGISFLSTRERSVERLKALADKTPRGEMVLGSTAIRRADGDLVLEWDTQGRSRHDETEAMR